ncbi:hypothetical protein [Mesorhizobium sp. M0323]|uniref:hypothetical protein n=1 Tax=Mesorhizobium sp. M0323 TaxID=2956938 RepID=UPI00333A368E
MAKDSSGELAKARVKIAELERKIGQQAVDLDFQQALQHVGKPRRQSGAQGGTASTRSSERSWRPGCKARSVRNGCAGWLE